MTLKPAAALLTAVATASLIGQPARSADALRDYPAFDYQIAGVVGKGINGKRLRRLLADAPADVQTFELLWRGERIGEALPVLRRILDGPPATVAAALRVVGDAYYLIQMDDTRGYAATLGDILEPVRRRLPALSREEAARIAVQLVLIDAYRDRSNGTWEDRTARFVADYSGTEEALLAEVNLLNRFSLKGFYQMLADLDRFAAAHPGSVAGAKALYLKAAQLATNAAVTGIERRGSDPAPRFLEVVDIVRELESGRYPSCEWVRRAPRLVVEFFYVSDPAPAFASGSVDRMLAAFREFVRTHVDWKSAESLDEGIGYVVTTRMAVLFRQRGDGVAGVESVMDDLEARAPDRSPVRLFRALYYLRESTQGPASDRAAMATKARDTLTLLAAERSGDASRKALAVLALELFKAGEIDRALPLLERYLDQYPQSAWAWVAALRIGQIHEGRGDWQRAVTAYRRPVVAGDAEPVARVLSEAYAAGALEAAGQLDAARLAYERAVASWDPDYGQDYALAAGAAAPRIPLARWRVSRDALSTRAADLGRTAAMPGGALIERGRWQLDRGEYAASMETLAAYLKQFPRSPAAEEARHLRNRAVLERALEVGRVEGAISDAAEAMRLLDTLAKEPADGVVGIARIARATLLFNRGDVAGARLAMKAALDALVADGARRQFQPAPASSDADVAAIRRAIFRPTGDLAVFKGTGWNAFRFPESAPPYVIVSTEVAVTEGGKTSTRAVRHSFPDVRNVIYLTNQEREVVARIVAAFGGTKVRAPASPIETPNQPVGASAGIVAFWATFFPARAGHWGGWELLTYPTLGDIEFLDSDRTRATAKIGVGYSGATVVLEKRSGTWHAVRLTNMWVT